MSTRKKPAKNATKNVAKKTATSARKKTQSRSATPAGASRGKTKTKITPREPAADIGADADDAESWNLRLYVAGQTPKSLSAFANLKQLCEEHLSGRYHIEVIDLLEKPQLAAGDQIVAIPTLVRKLPAPIKRIIGNLSNLERVLVGMDLKPHSH